MALCWVGVAAWGCVDREVVAAQAAWEAVDWDAVAAWEARDWEVVAAWVVDACLVAAAWAWVARDWELGDWEVEAAWVVVAWAAAAVWAWVVEVAWAQAWRMTRGLTGTCPWAAVVVVQPWSL